MKSFIFVLLLNLVQNPVYYCHQYVLTPDSHRYYSEQCYMSELQQIRLAKNIVRIKTNRFDKTFHILNKEAHRASYLAVEVNHPGTVYSVREETKRGRYILTIIPVVFHYSQDRKETQDGLTVTSYHVKGLCFSDK